MPQFSRIAITATAALALTLTGCASDEVPEGPPPPAAPPLPADPSNVTTLPPTVPVGVTPAGEVYGPGCNQVPTSGEGSVEGMADDPVATAAGNNPLLSRLAEAVRAAGLTDTLNDPNASYTVFAPANSAFEALPPGTLDQVLADPKGRLTDILTYHVVPQRYDAQGLSEAGTVTTVQGTELTVAGEPDFLVVDQQEQASVLCGNIDTANATVFVIDKVLMP